MAKLVLTENARIVLEKRYLRKDEAGRLEEKPEQLFARVARAVASVEKKDRAGWANRFKDLMISRRFLPNTPTLMNAGYPGGQLSACYVLPIEDSLDGIFDSLKYAAKIHQSGGGTGFSFSKIRAGGNLVKSTHGVASGPVSFLKIFDTTTETIKQGGARRGANMAVLRVDHPDILDFIDCKRDHRSILNFNISVGATDAFMEALESGGTYELKSPKTGKVLRSIAAREVFDRMVQAAWECGDPGMVFLDRINRMNPTPKLGEMESTNPCVTGDTRVWVDGKGLIPIAELVGEKPRVSTELAGPAEFRPVTQVLETGVHPVYRLRTVEGYELRLTGDHRVMTDRGDVETQELEKGDRIRLLEAALEPVSRDSSDARLGEVIGWLVGDGHFTVHEQGKPTAVLSFYGEDKKEAAPRILSALESVLGSGSAGLNFVESRDLAYIRSQRLRAAFQEFGVGPDCKSAVPECVWRGSADLVSGYLRGLFSADGSVQGTLEKGLSVRLSSNELGLLKEAQLLLLRLGIKAVIYPNRRVQSVRPMPDGKGGMKDYVCQANHELVIGKSSLKAFASQVGFVIDRKEKLLQERISGYSRGPYQERFYATVEELVLEGEEVVYDLTEPASSHFHANGLLVHNCGEQPLLPFESCNLGSLNLGEYLRKGKIQWEELAEDTRVAVRFLDNVIDLNAYPLEQSRKITLRNRKIGLGVMGFADLLLMMNAPYGSEESYEIAEKVMSFIEREARLASAELAKKRGAFPNWKGSLWEKLGYPPLRNATVTTVAPTGTISIIAGASSGIEPIFSGVFYRNVLSGERLVEIHPAVEKAFVANGVSLGEISDDKIAQVLGQAWSPAQHVPIEAHVRMQAVFQRHSDSAVSKTVNLPSTSTPEDVGRAYRLAYALGCKGITIYRDQSRPTQVLEKPKTPVTPPETPQDTGPESCPSC